MTQRHVGTFGVVRPQQTGHEQKEVKDARLTNRGTNRRAPFALAEDVVLHVRMGDVVLSPCRIRLQRNDAIVGQNVMAEFGPAELNLERPQVDALEHDRLGGDLNLALARIELELREFRPQGNQVIVKIADRGEGTR